jgi:predicted phage-related endonuclease
MFDTLTYANKLKEAGFTERQAETIATTQAELIDKQLVTREYLDSRIAEVRRDLKELGTSTKRDLKELETSTKRDLKELETSTKRDLKELELKFEGQFLLLKWMQGFVLAGILSLLIKAFFTH